MHLLVCNRSACCWDLKLTYEPSDHFHIPGCSGSLLLKPTQNQRPSVLQKRKWDENTKPDNFNFGILDIRQHTATKTFRLWCYGYSCVPKIKSKKEKKWKPSEEEVFIYVNVSFLSGWLQTKGKEKNSNVVADNSLLQHRRQTKDQLSSNQEDGLTGGAAENIQYNSS